MELINDHGLTINLDMLTEAANTTKSHRIDDCLYNGVYYNTQTGEVWIEQKPWDGCNTHYDIDIILCELRRAKMTEQEIADAIYQRIIFLRDSRDYGTPCHIDWNSLHD